MISLIVALTKEHIIGINNTIPWNLSQDLVWFKHKTLNKPVIMGRKTFESIGKPLPGRYNIVLSSYRGSSYRSINMNHYNNKKKEVTWVTTPKQAICAAGNVKEIMVIGGEKVYETFFSKAETLYLTYINVKISGDARFPQFNLNEWKTVFSEFHKANEVNRYNYQFKIMSRKKL